MKSLRLRVAFVAAVLLVGTWLLLHFRETPAPLEPHPFFAGAPRRLNIAHRGASAERTEHTWEAYELALRDGAHVLELDLRMTSDDVLVVVHDGDLVRLTGQSVVVAESTFAQLTAAAGERAPMPLSAVLERFPGRLNLEIKDRRVEAARRLSELLRAAEREQSVIVASFHADVLEAFRSHAGPAVATSAHSREAFRFYASYLLGLPSSPDFVALQIPTRFKGLRLDHPDFLAYAHRHGLFVHYWTIDDETEMRRLLALGADGIMTNLPRRLSEVLFSF